MATAAQHKLQAQHNRELLQEIDVGRFPDWSATIIFYTAVHLVQMLFASKGGKSGSHKNRNHTLRRQYPQVWKDYHPLYSFSRLSRYWCMRVKPTDVPELERHLESLEQTIDRLIG